MHICDGLCSYLDNFIPRDLGDCGEDGGELFLVVAPVEESV